MTPSKRDSPAFSLLSSVWSATELLFCSGNRKLFLELFSGRGLGRKSDRSAPAIASIAADVTEACIVAAAEVAGEGTTDGAAEGTVGGAVGRGGGTEAVVVIEAEGTVAVEVAVMEAVRVVVVAGSAGRGGAVVGITFVFVVGFVEVKVISGKVFFVSKVKFGGSGRGGGELISIVVRG